MSKPRLLAAVALAFALVTSSCGSNASSDESGQPPPSSAPTPTEQSSDAPEAGAAITTASSDFGPMLFDDNDQAIYIWEVEKSQTPECYDDCADAWPPVLTTGEPIASGDVDPSLLGTTPREDGTTQVTYNGHPLYFYADEGPGEVKCHNVSTHGGLWWVITPDGDRAA